MTTITEKYLEALQPIDDWVTVSEWAFKVGEAYPELLAKADQEAKSHAKESTGLREIAARISSAISRGAYLDQIEIDATDTPRKIKFVSKEEHETHINEALDEDVAPLKRGEIIKRDSEKLSVHEQYRIAEFESISKQLKQFFGLEFEVDHAQALLNGEKPGQHHPDNLQLLLKAHNGKKNSHNWQRFSVDEQVNYVLAAINMQKLIATRFSIECDDSILENLLHRLRVIYD